MQIQQKLEKSIAHSFLKSRLETIKEIFHSDLIRFIILYSNNYCIVSCVKSISHQKIENLTSTFQNLSNTFYPNHFKESVNSTKTASFKAGVINVMNGVSFDNDIKNHMPRFNNLLIDDLPFLLMTSLVSLWSSSSIPESILDDLTNGFNIYMRYKFLTHDLDITQNRIFYKMVGKIKLMSNLKIGEKIVELLNFVSATNIEHNSFGHLKFILPSIVASGIEDILIPFLWFSRIMIFFPQYVSRTWRNSFPIMNEVKDSIFAEMSLFNFKLMQFVNLYFFDQSSPLCDE